MENALPGLLPIVDGEAESVPDVQLPRDLARGEQQVTEQRLVFFLCVDEPGHFLLRNEEHMCRRLRVDVAKREA
ncbi:hypothetical protein D3C83_227810 [compost metagenome]